MPPEDGRGPDPASARLDTLRQDVSKSVDDLQEALSAVLGRSERVLGTLPPDDGRRADVAEIHRAAQELLRLTEALRASAAGNPKA